MWSKTARLKTTPAFKHSDTRYGRYIAVLMHTDLKELAESMPSASSALGISRNWRNEPFFLFFVFLGSRLQETGFIHHGPGLSTTDWSTEVHQTTMLSRIQRPSSGSLPNMLGFSQRKDALFTVGRLTLKMDTCFRVIASKMFEGRPRISVPFCRRRASRRHTGRDSAYASGSDGWSDLRHIVGTRPRRSILYIVVTWHMFRCDSDSIRRVFRKQQGGRQACHTGAAIMSSLD